MCYFNVVVVESAANLNCSIYRIGVKTVQWR